MLKNPIRVLCVDDHEVLVEGLTSRLRLEADFEVVGCLHSGDELIAEAGRCRPDVVTMDIAMSGADPFEVASCLHVQLPEVRIVFLTAHLRDRYLDAAFKAGAWGYLYKGDALDEIVDGLRRVSRGEYVISPEVIKAIKNSGLPTVTDDEARQSKLSTLTTREVQVLELIGRGLSTEEIADTLHRSRKTIDTHRANLMKKLGIHDRTGLALYAVAEGLVDVELIDVSSRTDGD